MNDFNKLIELLDEYGYLITEDICLVEDKEYRMVTIDGNNIRAAFCEEGYGGYKSLDGRVAIENAGAFNKWSQAPVSLPIPTTDEQREIIMGQLEYWGTAGGFELSNGYAEPITSYDELM